MDDSAMKSETQSLNSQDEDLRREVDALKNENLQLRYLFTLKAEETMGKTRREVQEELESNSRQKLLLQNALNEVEKQRDEALEQLDDLMKRHNELLGEIEVHRAKATAEAVNSTGSNTKSAKSSILPPSLNYNNQDVVKAKQQATHHHHRNLSSASFNPFSGHKAGKIVQDSWITVGGPLALAESAYIRGDLQKALVSIDALLMSTSTGAQTSSTVSTKVRNTESSSSNPATPTQRHPNELKSQVFPLATHIRAHLLQSRVLHAARDHDRATAAVNKALAMASDNKLGDLRKEAQFQKGVLLCDDSSTNPIPESPASSELGFGQNKTVNKQDVASHGYTGSDLLRSKLLQARLEFSVAGGDPSSAPHSSDSLPTSQELMGRHTGHGHKCSGSRIPLSRNEVIPWKHEEKRRSAHDQLTNKLASRVEEELTWGRPDTWDVIHEEEDEWSHDSGLGDSETGEDFRPEEIRAFEYFEGHVETAEIV
ncbi:MAG: hypothetical protein M1831_006589 [Alyxoria varia]|nr:MAG: hypothetical protein M1831_006589 [Alyxoria varia]